MTVRFVNRVFPPATGATGLHLADLADGLAARGWSVEVVTGPAPGAPAQETRPSGVAVRRLSGAPLGHASLLRRAAGYAALWPRLVREAARAPHPDGIVLLTDPPLLAAAGAWLRRRTGAAVVLWTQDLYPDVAVALGVLPRAAAAPLRAVARRALRAADAVVVVGRCMAGRVAGSGVRPDRLHVIPNRALAAARPSPRDAAEGDVARSAFRAAHGLEGRFVVMYSGNLGRAHPLSGVLDAAARLAPMRPDVLVVFVGDGPQRAWVEAEVTRRHLPNVRVLPPQPTGALAGSLGAADLHLVTLDGALAGLVVPSKVYGALAVGRPVLVVAPRESEAVRVVDEAGAGTVLPPDASGEAVAAAILHWADDPVAAATAGRRAASVPPSDTVGRFDALLRSVARAPRASARRP